MYRTRKPKSGKRNAAFWKAHLKAWQRSDLNRAEYCRRHKLSYDARTYWYDKTKEVNSQHEPSPIVPVMSIQPADGPAHSQIKIRFRQEFIIELEAEFDEAVLRKVIRALEG